MTKSKNKPVYNNIEFDSFEELEFYYWCEEALENGIISSFLYQPDSFILCDKKTYKVEKKLKTKTKIVDKHLFHPHQYTADFKIFINGKYQEFFTKSLITIDKPYAYIDIKGTFQNFDGKRSFSINKKWVYDKFNEYINEVTPKIFFKLTWVPKKATVTPKTKKPKKIYESCPTITQVLSTF